MTSQTAEKPARRSRVTLAIAIAIVVVLAILFFVFSTLYTEILWYDQLGYLSVLTTQWLAGGVMFVIGFLFFEGVIGIGGERFDFPEWLLPAAVIAIGVVLLIRGMLERGETDATA